MFLRFDLLAEMFKISDTQKGSSRSPFDFENQDNATVPSEHTTVVAGTL